MGFSCNEKKILTPTIPNYDNRDLGLSNIYNLNSDTGFCLETFNSPLYYMSGATKPITNIFSGCTSGITETCDEIHNLSEVDSFDLSFFITGGTSYTGYTGQFCYKLLPREYIRLTGITGTTAVLNITTADTSYESCVQFSAITSTTITENIVSGIDLPIGDNEYRLMDYVKYYNNTCVVSTGNTINTWDISDIPIKFDYDKDWYFVTVTNPPKPFLFKNTPPPRAGTLFTDIIESIGDSDPSYALKHVPEGQVVNAHVNGILLSPQDYSLDYSQYPVGPVIIKFNSETEARDVINVIYIINQTDTNIGQINKSDAFSIESLVFTGATTGITATTINTVNYNPTNALYEIFLNYDILGGSDAVLSINGVNLTENIGFYKSKTVPNKLNLHPNVVLKINDIISIFYFKELGDTENGDLGKLKTNDVSIKWTLNSEIPSNRFSDTESVFTTEITEENDITYSAVTYTAETLYNGDILYDETFENVVVDKKYIYRVCLRKSYITLTDDEIYTTKCSDNGSFDLTGGQAKYSI